MVEYSYGIELPERLFRYRSFSNDFSAVELDKAVGSQEYFHVSPNSWNDPFDFKPVWENFSIREVNALLKDSKNQGRFTRDDMTRISGRQISRREYRSLSARQKKNPVELARNYLRVFREHVAEFHETVLACCFSETGQSVPMWAHYSNNHRGICLELKFIMPEFILPKEPIPLPVDYTDKRPRLNMRDAFDFMGKTQSSDERKADQVMRSLFLKKNIDWGYEREWRSVVLEASKPEYRFLRCLKVARILVGLRADARDVDRVKEVVAGRVEVVQAKMSEAAFGIEF